MPTTAVETQKRKAPLRIQAPGNGENLLGKPGDEAAEALDMARLPGKLVQEMSSLGVDVRAAGIVHTDLGFAFATRKAVHLCVQQLEGKIQKASSSSLHEIVGSLTKCARAMSMLSSKNIGADEVPAGNAAPRRAFAPGQNAQFHLHQHVHHEAK